MPSVRPRECARTARPGGLTARRSPPRTSGTTEAEFGRLFDEGQVLRTHVLRPTWHYVRPDDIRWLIGLTAPRIRRTFAQVQRGLDLDDAKFEVSRGIIAEVLSGGVHLTRSAIGERLREAGLPSATSPTGPA